MAAYTSLLLVAALCTGAVYSLTCYTCASESSNSKCMTATNCSATDTSCMTSVVSGGIGSLSAATITKTCTAVCAETGFNAVVVSTKVSCCNTDLCNTSGTSSIKATYTVLAAALAAIGVLLRSSSM
ncbi:lymphocyte antigen 6E-like [Bufo gargarizans]|uniref:lymphocyte antigen 6E-like n=1 Tax=Bufo gargarizans TaxID=30331 RepID=UPI001CF381F6|nr:lymphocyte antigen 6E-like [Bufo gargarizans]